MNAKGVIIGIFVRKNRILSLLEELKNKFHIKSEKVFVYEIDTNKLEYLVTFKTYNKDKFIKNIKCSTVMHVKNQCLFSINALNKLIEQQAVNLLIPNNEYIINWNMYKDKLIVLTNGKLSISNLIKIEDKSIFFK